MGQTEIYYETESFFNDIYRENDINTWMVLY